jgi:hypothetical protein
MKQYYGDPIDDWGPMYYLFQCGWKEASPGFWHKPTDHEPTTQEWDSLQFLCDEWDHAYDSTLACNRKSSP